MANLKDMKVLDSVNRLRGDMPKIGIRPTIDGRRKGIRESLEDQTMNMAISVKKLFEENLRHSNGLPVECVIADSCIGGVAEAADASEKFRKEGVGVSLTVTPCWCYGAETMDMDPLLPKAVWGFNGTERPGAVYLAAVLAAHSQKGIPAFGIYGNDICEKDDTQIPEDVKEKLLRFARAGLAVATMKGKSYLSIGSVSMGIAGSIVNEEFFQKFLGMRNEYVDMSEISRRINEGIYDESEFQKALIWTKENCIEGKDNNDAVNQFSRIDKDKQWQYIIKMTLVTRDLFIGNEQLAKIGYIEESMGHNAIAGGFQGQRQWTDQLPNGDFMEAILNSSFDWSGIREAFVLATENDSLNGAAMLFGHLLTNTAQIFADVRTYWSPDSLEKIAERELTDRAGNGIIHLINSGAAALDGTGEQTTSDGKPIMKAFWDINCEEAGKCLDATSWRPANTGYFRGGGYSSDFMTKGGMPVTMSRLNLVAGLGPVLQIAEGFTVNLPQDVSDRIDVRTDQTWPTTWFAPSLTGYGSFRDVYSVMNNWGANHGALTYGHVGADLITMASMLRIPICMHNVPEEKIFRPSTWSAFGMDPEASDYRACRTFGPLYK